MQNNNGNTSLHVAVKTITRGYASKKIVKMLLENGANSGIVNNEGFKPHDLAYSVKNASLGDLLLFAQPYGGNSTKMFTQRDERIDSPADEFTFNDRSINGTVPATEPSAPPLSNEDELIFDIREMHEINPTVEPSAPPLSKEDKHSLADTTFSPDSNAICLDILNEETTFGCLICYDVFRCDEPIYICCNVKCKKQFCTRCKGHTSMKKCPFCRIDISRNVDRDFMMETKVKCLRRNIKNKI